MNIVQLRRIVSILLFIALIIVSFTGIILYLKTTNVLYTLVEWAPTKSIDTLHTYSGFAMAGLALIHVYLNWTALKSYFKPRRKHR